MWCWLMKTPSTFINPIKQFQDFLKKKTEITPIEEPFILEWKYVQEMTELRRIWAPVGSTLFSDMLFIYNAIRKHNLKKGIEIGSWYGYGIYYMSHALKRNDGELISIDIKPLKARIRSISIKNREIIKGDSKRVLPQFARTDVDFVFVDGDHSYDAVSKEIEILSKFQNLKIIFFHDMYPTSPAYKAWVDHCHLLNATEDELFIMDDSYYFFDENSPWKRYTGALKLKK